MNVYFIEFLGIAILVLLVEFVCANVNLKRNMEHGADCIVITTG